MTNILTLYREWRHSKGYGVHSPYAYMLVTDILALPKEYTYYDEPLLRPKTLPRLALALQRYQWRFGREAVYLDSAQKIPHFIETFGHLGYAIIIISTLQSLRYRLSLHYVKRIISILIINVPIGVTMTDSGRLLYRFISLPLIKAIETF